MASAWYFPVPAVRTRQLNDSYLWRWPGNHPDNKPYQRGHHYGIDIPGPEGSIVHTPRRAKVVKAGWGVWGRDYGNAVLIRWTHLPWPYAYVFMAHFEHISVGVGQVVDRGEKLGYLGQTGNVSGPHVHLELHSRSDWLSGMHNPYDLLEGARRAML